MIYNYSVTIRTLELVSGEDVLFAFVSCQLVKVSNSCMLDVLKNFRRGRERDSEIRVYLVVHLFYVLGCR